MLFILYLVAISSSSILTEGQITSYKNYMKCGFEEMDLCMFTPIGSDIAWLQGFSTNMAPAGAQSSSNFLYVNFQGTMKGKDSQLVSPSFISGNYQVQFYTFTSTFSLGRVELTVIDKDQRSSLLWALDLQGANKDSWQFVTVTFSASSPSKIQFNVKSGGSSLGRFALDEILLLHDINSQLNLSVSSQYKCDFRYGSVCGMGQVIYDDEFDWTIQKDKTPSFGTGPACGHTSCGPGDYFAFIETSSPTKSGEKAILRTPSLYAPTSCIRVSFWYHGYGSGLGTLKLQYGTNIASMTTVLTARTVSVNEWKQVSAVIYSSDVMIAFVASRGRNSYGDYAIDDIIISDCSTAGVSSSSPNNPPLIKASFTSGSIFPFIQDINDDFDWRIASGPTLSSDTGPTKGHTCSSCSSDYYAYIETSSPRREGDRALMYTASKITSPSGCTSISFWYHGYGSHLGSLQIMYSYSGATNTWFYMWQAPKYSLKIWRHATFQTQLSGIHIGIEGKRGSGLEGDFAVDDITIADCALVPTTTMSIVDTTPKHFTHGRTTEYHYYTGGRIQSPHYPQEYGSNANVSWVILVQPIYTIQINIQTFRTEYKRDNLRISAFLQDGSKQEIEKYSGSLVSDGTMLNTYSNHVELNFTSDDTVNYDGFRLNWYLLDSNGGSIANTNNAPDPEDEILTVGAIVGIVIGSLLAFLILCCCCYCCCCATESESVANTTTNNRTSNLNQPQLISMSPYPVQPETGHVAPANQWGGPAYIQGQSAYGHDTPATTDMWAPPQYPGYTKPEPGHAVAPLSGAGDHVPASAPPIEEQVMGEPVVTYYPPHSLPPLQNPPFIPPLPPPADSHIMSPDSLPPPPSYDSVVNSSTGSA